MYDLQEMQNEEWEILKLGTEESYGADGMTEDQ